MESPVQMDGWIMTRILGFRENGQGKIGQERECEKDINAAVTWPQPGVGRIFGR